MSIISRLTGAAKRAAAKVKKVAGSVVKAIAGTNNSAAALNGTYVQPGSSLKESVNDSFYGPVQGPKQPIGITKYTPTFSTPASGPNYSASTYSPSPYGPTKPTTLKTSGGGSAPKIEQSLSQFGATYQSPTTLTSNSLKASSSNIGALPTTPSVSNPGSINNGGLAGSLGQTYNYNPDNNTFTPITTDTAETDQRTKDNAAFQEMLGLMPQKENVLNDRDVLRQKKEILKQRKEVNDYTSQLNSVIAKQNQDLLSLRQTGSQEGVTEAVYGGQQATINREAAVRALPIQAAIATAQGNLELAQDYLTEITAMKKEEIDNEYTYKMGQYNAISEYVKGKDKEELEKRKVNEERKYKESQKLADMKDELMKSASIQKASPSVTQRIAAARTTEEAISAAGQYAGDILDRQYKQAQVDKIYADAADKENANNVIKRISQINPNSPTYIDDLILSSSGGPLLTGDQTKPISKALTVVGQIDSLQSSLKNVDTGPILGILKSANPYDVQAQLVKGQLQAIIPNLARGVYGEVGVLTDNDIANYRKTIGNLRSTEELNNLLLSMTLKTVQNGIDDQLEVAASAGRDVSGFYNLRKRLTDKINGINSSIGISGDTNTVNANQADVDYISSLNL